MIPMRRTRRLEIHARRSKEGTETSVSSSMARSRQDPRCPSASYPVHIHENSSSVSTVFLVASQAGGRESSGTPFAGRSRMGLLEGRGEGDVPAGSGRRGGQQQRRRQRRQGRRLLRRRRGGGRAVVGHAVHLGVVHLEGHGQIREPRVAQHWVVCKQKSRSGDRNGEVSSVSEVRKHCLPGYQKVVNIFNISFDVLLATGQAESLAGPLEKTPEGLV